MVLLFKALLDNFSLQLEPSPASSKQLKMELPFDLAIPLLGLYPKNPETPIQKNHCLLYTSDAADDPRVV